MTTEHAGSTDEDQGGADLVTISRDQIQQAISAHRGKLNDVTAVAAELALSPLQVMSLMAGRADLRLTQDQLANLRASVASALAGSQEAEQQDGISLCGSSSSPSTTTTTSSVPKVTGTNTTVTETAPGTKVKDNDAVGAGHVTIRTNVKGTVGSRAFNNMFVLSYKGADSQDAHWLQFIHREVIGIDAKGVATPITGAVSSSGTKTGRSYDFTPGGDATTFGTPAESNYNTDSGSASDPFYESGFAGNRSADATAIYDNPAAMSTQVQLAFSNGATRVISRAHFDTFLVQVDKVTYHSSLTMAYDFASSAASPTPVTTLHSAGAASALPSTIQKRFHAQFPAFNFIK